MIKKFSNSSQPEKSQIDRHVIEVEGRLAINPVAVTHSHDRAVGRPDKSRFGQVQIAAFPDNFGKRPGQSTVFKEWANSVVNPG
ncbi:MAG: hypothetical protein WBI18_02515 [Candidatus Saccharicenans sp.]